MAADTSIDLIINQKDSFLASFTVKDANSNIVDLTGYTASAKYKTDYFATDASAVSFTTAIATPANTGVITISLSANQTANLTPNIKYVYDVAITQTATQFKTRIVQGSIKVSPGVT